MRGSNDHDVDIFTTPAPDKRDKNAFKHLVTLYTDWCIFKPGNFKQFCI